MLYACVTLCVYMYVETRFNNSGPQLHPTYFFETGSVAEPEAYQFDKSGFPETLIVVLTKIWIAENSPNPECT